jgi:predicted aldo/keto reductase-like oxidoreductase
MGAAAAAPALMGAAEVEPGDAQESGAVPTRALGRTGAAVSIVGLGGYHLGKQADENESVRIIRRAIDRGVTFMDNSWDYNGGQSELRMGKALAGGYRDRVFLMTKIDGRTREAATAQLDQSRRRLRADVIDLVQIHEVIRMGDPAAVFGPDGAVAALVAARDAGKVRFIGFTGHKDPAIHLAMIEEADRNGFTFDTVQMPLNVMDVHYRSFEREVLPAALARGMGVLGMKAMGDQFILKSGVVNAVECLRYAMSLPVSTTITGCDSMPILDQALGVARDFTPMSPEEMNALRARTARAAANGHFERYKTTLHHDSTTAHPEWLRRAAL